MSTFNVIEGTEYDDTLIGGSGNDQIWGFDGNDTIFGDGIEIWIYDSSITFGNDQLMGSGGADIIGGDAGLVYAENSLVTFGNDTISGGSGTNTITVDYLSFSDLPLPENPVWSSELLGDTEGTYGANADIAFGSDKINGGSHNDLIVGDAAVCLGIESTFTFGHDILDGKGGNDLIIGDIASDLPWIPGANNTYNFGHDILSGGSGNDILMGDALFLVQLNDPDLGAFGSYNMGNDLLAGGEGNDFIVGDVNVAYFSGVSVMGNDTLQGGSGDDHMFGDATVLLASQDQEAGLAPATCTLGDDILDGGAGNDTLYGDAGNIATNIVVSGGNDTLNGGAGDDWLYSGYGNDMLTGGKGSDLFVFDTLPNSAGTNVDTITDFSHGQDKIALVPGIFNVNNDGNFLLAPDDFAVVTGATAFPDVHVIYNSDTGELWYDADGAGPDQPALQIAVLIGHPTLTSSDIQILS